MVVFFVSERKILDFGILMFFGIHYLIMLKLVPVISSIFYGAVQKTEVVHLSVAYESIIQQKQSDYKVCCDGS